jgi:hypothetical protein
MYYYTIYIVIIAKRLKMLIKGYYIKVSTTLITNERIIIYPNTTSYIRIKGYLTSSLGVIYSIIANPKDLKSIKNQLNRIIYLLILRRSLAARTAYYRNHKIR